MPVAELKMGTVGPGRWQCAGMEQGMPCGEERAGKEDIPLLMEALQYGDTRGSMAAAAALGQIGAPAVRPLVQALTGTATAARWRVALALTRVGWPAARPLIEVLNTEAEEEEAEAILNLAIWALGRVGDARAVKPLVAVMKSGDTESCRGMAAAALLRLGYPGGVAAVKEALCLEETVLWAFVLEEVEGTG